MVHLHPRNPCYPRLFLSAEEIIDQKPDFRECERVDEVSALYLHRGYVFVSLRLPKNMQGICGDVLNPNLGNQGRGKMREFNR
jgi:hypothetical protein